MSDNKNGQHILHNIVYVQVHVFIKLTHINYHYYISLQHTSQSTRPQKFEGVTKTVNSNMPLNQSIAV